MGFARPQRFLYDDPAELPRAAHGFVGQAVQLEAGSQPARIAWRFAVIRGRLTACPT